MISEANPLGLAVCFQMGLLWFMYDPYADEKMVWDLVNEVLI